MLKGSIEWEHNPGEEFVLRFKPPTMPDAFGVQISVTGKELLLALKSLIDAAIGKTEEAGEKKAEKGRTKIDVE